MQSQLLTEFVKVGKSVILVDQSPYSKMKTLCSDFKEAQSDKTSLITDLTPLTGLRPAVW